MSNLSLKNINKIYPNGFHAVYDFNLEIKDGEFITLVGPSGCGKSTTLRMIAGLENISEGSFYIGDKLVNDLSPRDRGIAMVFQSYALYPNITVYENLAFGLELQGLDADVIDERVNKIAKILGLEQYLDRKPRQLSGGQCQRVAVGRAIIRKVDIFLMDEPLSNLDAKQRVTMRSEIIDIHRKVKATTIYVTHDQTEAMTMSDRIVVMKDGYVQQVGTPAELYFTPRNLFVAKFIGEPPMNTIHATIKNDNLYFDETDEYVFPLVQKFSKIKNYQKLHFGFRPEAVKIKYDNTNDGIEINGSVELTELLGDNTNVYVKVGPHNVILKCDPHDVPKMGEPIKFLVPYEEMYFFDYETEKVIIDE